MIIPKTKFEAKNGDTLNRRLSRNYLLSGAGYKSNFVVK